MADVTGKIMQNASDYEKRAETFKQERLAPAMEKADAASENLEPNLPRGDYTPTAAPQKGEGISDNPLKLFANAGAALGTLLSFKARRPLVSSMEALAAAGQAINKKDYDDYAKQMQIWKDQNKLALDTAKQQSTIWKNDFSMRKGNADVLQANVKALVAAGMLDAKQAEIAGKTWESLQKHYDSVSATAARLKAAEIAHEDTTSLRQDAMIKNNPKLAGLISAHPELLRPENKHILTAAIADTVSDVSGAGGSSAYTAFGELDSKHVPAAQQWMQAISGGKTMLPQKEREVLTANLGFVDESNSLREAIAARPELVGIVAGGIAKMQPYLKALEKTGATSEQLAAAQERLSIQGVDEFVRAHPESVALGDDAKVLAKRLNVLGFQQAAGMGRINQWAEKQAQSWVSPEVGASTLAHILDTLSADAQKKLGPLKPENMRPELRRDKYLADTLGSTSLLKMYQDIRTWQNEIDPATGQKKYPADIPIGTWKQKWLNLQGERL